MVWQWSTVQLGTLGYLLEWPMVWLWLTVQLISTITYLLEWPAVDIITNYFNNHGRQWLEVPNDSLFYTVETSRTAQYPR